MKLKQCYSVFTRACNRLRESSRLHPDKIEKLKVEKVFRP